MRNEPTRYYIAGPMTGCHLYNFPAFERAAEELRAEGHDVISPHEIDMGNGFDPSKLPDDHDWFSWPDGLDKMKTIEADIEAIKQCDCVFVLDGHEQSTGATAEIALARWMGKNIEYESEVLV